MAKLNINICSLEMEADRRLPTSCEEANKSCLGDLRFLDSRSLCLLISGFVASMRKKKIGINTALRMIINGWFELSRDVRNVVDHATL